MSKINHENSLYMPGNMLVPLGNRNQSARVDKFHNVHVCTGLLTWLSFSRGKFLDPELPPRRAISSWKIQLSPKIHPVTTGPTHRVLGCVRRQPLFALPLGSDCHPTRFSTAPVQLSRKNGIKLTL
jgi:hypothetical protein